MKKICIFIPTYKRPECIHKWLESIPEQYLDLFDIYISDSSENTETEKIVIEYSQKHKNRIAYQRVEEYPDKTTDLKVVDGFKQLYSEYDYIYLCGDGLIVDFERLYDIIKTYIGQNYDIIHFYPEQIEDRCIYNSGLDFAKDCGWYVTYYGATIISSKLLMKSDFENLLHNFRNTGFLVWEMIFKSIASMDQRILVLKEFPVSKNPFKKSNSSYQPNRFMQFWIVNWCKVVDYLPDFYDGEKLFLKRQIGDKLNLYGFENLVRLRNTQNLDYKVFKEYKDRMPNVTKKSPVYIFIISVIPVPLLNLMVKIKKCMVRIYRHFSNQGE